MNVFYKGQLYWFWGDTNRISYPLGNFNMSGAITKLPSEGGLDPDDRRFGRDDRQLEGRRESAQSH
jgi:hypothetical protein